MSNVQFGADDDTTAAIKKLQDLLSVDVDGKYGPKTLAAVKEFQSNSGLSPDGIVGQQTWAALGVAGMPTLTPSASTPVVSANTGQKIQSSTVNWSVDEATRQLQFMLGVTADGQFGPLTDKAVRVFQQSHNLPVDGIVGPNTWYALFQDKKVTGPMNPPTLKASGSSSPTPVSPQVSPPMNLGQPNPLSVKPNLMTMGNWPIFTGIALIAAALYKYVDFRDSHYIRRG